MGWWGRGTKDCFESSAYLSVVDRSLRGSRQGAASSVARIDVYSVPRTHSRRPEYSIGTVARRGVVPLTNPPALAERLPEKQRLTVVVQCLDLPVTRAALSDFLV